MTKSTRPPKSKIYFTVFVVAWTILCTVASQYAIAFPMALLLGSAASEPLWTLVFYLLSYTLALALIIKLPPRLVRLYRERTASKQVTSVDTSKPAAPADTSKHTALADAPETVSQAIDAPSELSTTPAELGVKNPPTFIDIGLAPIAYIIYIYLANIAMSIMKEFTWFDAEQSQDVGFGQYLAGFDRIVAVIAIVIVAPLAEELIMRGWLYGKLRQKWKIPLAAILTSLCFAVLHGQWNVGVTVFILSLVLCGLREITGTIWSGVLLHILTNGIAFYYLYIAV